MHIENTFPEDERDNPSKTFFLIIIENKLEYKTVKGASIEPYKPMREIPLKFNSDPYEEEKVVKSKTPSPSKYQEGMDAPEIPTFSNVEDSKRHFIEVQNHLLGVEDAEFSEDYEEDLLIRK